MRNPIGWFEIYVQDMARARRFYEGVFGFKLEHLPTPVSDLQEMEMWSFPGDMEKPGSSGALVKMPGVTSGGMGTMVYFSSSDCAVEEKRVTQFGGRIERPKTSIGRYGFISLVRDSEGNEIGIHSLR